VRGADFMRGLVQLALQLVIRVVGGVSWEVPAGPRNMGGDVALASVLLSQVIRGAKTFPADVRAGWSWGSAFLEFAVLFP